MIRSESWKKRMFMITAANALIFILIWTGINFSLVIGAIKVETYGLTDYMDEGYNSITTMAGIACPLLYSIGFYYLFPLDADYIILKHGRNMYEKIEVRRMLLFSLIFAILFIGTDALFLFVFIGVKMLLKYYFIQYIMLKLLMGILYFTLIGMMLFFLRNILKFNNIYIFAGELIIVFAVSLYYLFNLEISPVFYLNFSNEWFVKHTFDVITYVINAAKLILLAWIFQCLGKLVFLKRDIIGNEEI